MEQGLDINIGVRGAESIKASAKDMRDMGSATEASQKQVREQVKSWTDWGRYTKEVADSMRSVEQMARQIRAQGGAFDVKELEKAREASGGLAENFKIYHEALSGAKGKLEELKDLHRSLGPSSSAAEFHARRAREQDVLDEMGSIRAQRRAMDEMEVRSARAMGTINAADVMGGGAGGAGGGEEGGVVGSGVLNIANMVAKSARGMALSYLGYIGAKSTMGFVTAGADESTSVNEIERKMIMMGAKPGDDGHVIPPASAFKGEANAFTSLGVGRHEFAATMHALQEGTAVIDKRLLGLAKDSLALSNITGMSIESVAGWVGNTAALAGNDPDKIKKYMEHFAYLGETYKDKGLKAKLPGMMAFHDTLGQAILARTGGVGFGAEEVTGIIGMQGAFGLSERQLTGTSAFSENMMRQADQSTVSGGGDAKTMMWWRAWSAEHNPSGEFSLEKWQQFKVWMARGGVLNAKTMRSWIGGTFGSGNAVALAASATAHDLTVPQAIEWVQGTGEGEWGRYTKELNGGPSGDYLQNLSRDLLPSTKGGVEKIVKGATSASEQATGDWWTDTTRGGRNVVAGFRELLFDGEIQPSPFGYQLNTDYSAPSFMPPADSGAPVPRSMIIFSPDAKTQEAIKALGAKVVEVGPNQ